VYGCADSGEGSGLFKTAHYRTFRTVDRERNSTLYLHQQVNDLRLPLAKSMA
jgi:hypothetical protein